MGTITELYMSQSLSARVAAEVRGLTAKRGLRQKDVAAALGLSPAQMSERMRGRVPYRLDELEILAALFGVDPVDLMPKRPDHGTPDAALIPMPRPRVRRVGDRRQPHPGRPRRFVA